ncbi:dihydroneopterin aldolase [Cytobacillus sp. FJAT-53684]|uniref:7,8-dihydroneopterin aldolase n=1 Tax=Cytobacillus mangrovibacter TaxID=3299024 RepID=A0ABW6K7X3_9BACI
MDKIILNKMAFYGYHGVFPEETRLGQRFVIDLIVETNLQKAGETDHLEDSINYGEIYQVCKEIVEGKPFKLVEAVAEKIAREMLGRYDAIHQVTVKVIKPDPPIPGHYESVAVEIIRSRQQ